MPDLSADTIAQWLREREPAIAADLASAMPSTDEDPAVLPSVLRLGSLLDEALARSPERLKDLLRHEQFHNRMRVVVAHIALGRRLRLLHWLTEIDGLEDVVRDLLVADQSDTGAFLRADIRSLHRRALLSRIFDGERIAALLAASTQTEQPEAPS
jgi:hypothetical protein